MWAYLVALCWRWRYAQAAGVYDLKRCGQNKLRDYVSKVSMRCSEICWPQAVTCNKKHNDIKPKALCDYNFNVTLGPTID